MYSQQLRCETSAHSTCTTSVDNGRHFTASAQCKPYSLSSRCHWYVLASFTERIGKDSSACLSCCEKLPSDFLHGEQFPCLAATIRSSEIYANYVRTVLIWVCVTVGLSEHLMIVDTYKNDAMSRIL